MATKENLMHGESIARLIDHTLLKATATESEIRVLCDQALEHHFFSVCIPSCYVTFSHEILKGSDVKVCTVVGFPLGNTSSSAKASEAAQAVKDGASEIDMVINVGWLKSGKLQLVQSDISSVVQASGESLVKVILETCYLSDAEIVAACKICVDAGAHFVKTSTGFGTAGATVEHVRLMRKTVGSDVGVKASGGIRNLNTLQAMVAAGANRIGCSSGVAILQGTEGSGY